MSWTISPQYKDPYFSSVSLLLHGDGANNSTTFTDKSSNSKAVTPVADAKIVTGTPDPFGLSDKGVISFDKTGDRLTVAASADLALGTGDFTIEFWSYSRDVNGVGQRGYMQISGTSGGLQTSYTNALQFVQGIGSAGGGFNGGLAININNSWLGVNTAVLIASTWQHIVATRQSGTVRLFVNGIQSASGTLSGDMTQGNLVIGGYYDTSYLFDGYLREFRITKGIARYTSNFTPPTAPFPDL